MWIIQDQDLVVLVQIGENMALVVEIFVSLSDNATFSLFVPLYGSGITGKSLV